MVQYHIMYHITQYHMIHCYHLWLDIMLYLTTDIIYYNIVLLYLILYHIYIYVLYDQIT